YDPCSLVVLEALACGLPVITSWANGASELLHPLQEGHVVDDPHDHQRLAWCLWQLMDPERRSACAQAARKTAGQWTFEQHYRQLLGIFSEAAKRKRAGRTSSECEGRRSDGCRLEQDGNRSRHGRMPPVE